MTEHRSPADPPAPPHSASTCEELAAIAEDLAALSLRLDRTALSLEDGLLAMSADVASQAVHLAIVELRDCLVAA